MECQSESIQRGLLDLSGSITGAKVFGVSWRINPSRSCGCNMFHQKRQQDAERAGAATAQKRMRGSAAGWGSGAGFEADPVMRSHCSAWQNVSLKEPGEDTEPYPWRMPIPTEELEPASALLPVRPIVMWQSAMITKYDMMLIEFSRDGTNWTIVQRRKHYSVRKCSCAIIVTDPRNESTREITKVSRDVTEATPRSYLAPIELVPRPGWSKHLASRPMRPPVLRPPQREKKPLIVEVVQTKQSKVVAAAHVEKAKVDEVAHAERDKVHGVVHAESDEAVENDKVPQVCASKADVERVTEAPPQQQQQHSSDVAAVNFPESAAGPSDGTQRLQQRTVEQVFDVQDEKPRKEPDQVQQRSSEPAVDASLDEAPLKVTQRVPAKAAPEGRIARAVRLELDRVRFEKEARQKF